MPDLNREQFPHAKRNAVEHLTERHAVVDAGWLHQPGIANVWHDELHDAGHDWGHTHAPLEDPDPVTLVNRGAGTSGGGFGARPTQTPQDVTRARQYGGRKRKVM